MDCGGGHSGFDGGCSSAGADFGGSNFGGSDFGGMSTSHNTHFSTTTHSTFGAHPSSATTQWTSTTVSGSRVNPGSRSNNCGLVFLVIFFMGWFGVAGFMAYMAATNISPFLALPPICIALLGFFCFVCSIYQNIKKQRGLGGGVTVNQHTTTQPQVHPPPQQGASPHPGYPSSYPTSQQPQWTSAYSTNYGQQQYGMSGLQAPRPSAPPPSGAPEEDKPPAYDDVVQGGRTPLGFV